MPTTMNIRDAADCTIDRVPSGIGDGDGDSECIWDNDVSLEAETILSRAMHGIPNHDRNAILEEIHGVRCLAITETPESVSCALNEFDLILQEGNRQNNLLESSSNSNSKNDLFYTYNQIVAKRKKIHDEFSYNPEVKVRCLEKKLSYCENHYAIDDPAFRLRFLRSELFDVRKAVVRYCNYLNFVQELWGSVALEREIILSDLDRSENALFRKGYFQVLPFRDRSGRRIITLLGEMGNGTDKRAMAKAIFYVWDAATRDSAESQKTGSILVMEGYCWEDGIDSPNEFSKDDLELIRKIVVSVPSRIVAIHSCWPDAPIFKSFAKVLALAISRTERLRLRVQIGNPLEMRYNLKSHGIPVDLLARTESGTMKLGNHIAWMKIRKRLERRQLLRHLHKPRNGLSTAVTTTRNKNLVVFKHGTNNNNDQDEDAVIVECPLMTDVAFRQGTQYWHNPGNDVFRDMIIEYLGRKHQIWERSSNSNSSTAKDLHNSLFSEDFKGNSHIEFREWVIQQILESWNGRFLEWDKDLKAFCVMTDIRRIRSKVSVSIYNYRKVAGLSPSIERARYLLVNPESRNDGHNASSDEKRVAIDYPSSSFLKERASPDTTPAERYYGSRKRSKLATSAVFANKSDTKAIHQDLRGVQKRKKISNIFLPAKFQKAAT
eukprot:CAMPEP_0197177948 /NCGR_PEP_ID=MMETSP1423-20130617/3372_1 /TAXON_ID=476441 /ORGANISM="Pseudo-nitzschia heimii, Strain UNC1101" /LENGTH=661 /DNA_ID=CAMNT_0042627575 /DNA_START=57 /DNA_END=2042 /DNA_ORIENTATION=+